MTIVASFIAWDLARAGGIVAYVLLTLAVAAGLALSGRARVDGWPRFAVEDVHQFLGLLAGSFVTLHVLVLLADDYLGIGLPGFVVPFASRYEPVATGIGVLAAELLVALAISNRLRRRLPHRVWRRLHLLSFVVWLGSTIHGILQGTDTHDILVASLYVVSIAAISGVTAWRIVDATASDASRVAPPRAR